MQVTEEQQTPVHPRRAVCFHLLAYPEAWGRGVIGAREPARPLPQPRLCGGCGHEADVLELASCGVQAADPTLHPPQGLRCWGCHGNGDPGDRILGLRPPLMWSAGVLRGAREPRPWSRGPGMAVTLGAPAPDQRPQLTPSSGV